MEFRPLFIFGVARSGTNLLARMIDAHPDAKIALDPLMPLFRYWRNAVAGGVEQRLKGRLDPATPFQDYYFDKDGATWLDAMLDADASLPVTNGVELTKTVCARAAIESETLGRKFATWTGDTVADRFADALRIVASEERGEASVAAVVGIKEVWTVEFAAPLAKAFPNAKFLFIHRDPRAVLASLIALAKRDATQAAHTISYLRHWRKHVAVSQHLLETPQLGGRMMAVRFEDLVAAPALWTKRLADFLGIAMHPAMLKPGENEGWRGNSSFSEIQEITTAPVERWRQELDPVSIRTAECHCGPEMLIADYPLMNDWPVLPDVPVTEFVKNAAANPGSWRSDSGWPAADLDHERRRWSILQSSSIVPEREIREHFLFQPFFEKLRAGTSRQKIQMPVGAG